MDPRVVRRSARLAEAQRPAYPRTQPLQVPQNNQTSPYTSSSSVSSISSLDANVDMSPTVGGQTGFDGAPLPSPIQGDRQQNYFASMQPQQFQPQSQQPFQQQSFNNPYMGSRGGAGGQPETVPFLNNVNLLAEAAKRAQMACLMRDLGDCSL